MSKESYIGGDYIEITGGDNLLFAKGNIINTSELEVRQKGFNSGVSYGINKKAPTNTNNAFIPIIIPIIDEKDIFNPYEIFVNNTSEWNFSNLIELKYRKQKSHEVKFKNNSYGGKVKFKVEKGNSNANDADGGNIIILYFRDEKEKSVLTKIQNDVKYGDIISVDWDASKGITQLQFYANDNDMYFDGGINNVYCGAAKIKGSKVGRKLTKNIELLPVASKLQQLPGTYTSKFPEESFKIAIKYQNPKGMCFAITMKRVEKAYKDMWNIDDAIIVDTKHEDYKISGTMSPAIDDKYFGYGVGGALVKNGYGELITNSEIWEGKLEEGALIQYWNNQNQINWTQLKEEIKTALKGQNAFNFNGGHSVIFKAYIFTVSGEISGIKYYDYAGIDRKFTEFDKSIKIFCGANLKDKK